MIGFKNENITENFKPLSYSRNIYNLKSGIYSIKERIKIKLKNKFDRNKYKILVNPALIDIEIEAIEPNYSYYSNGSFLISVYEKSRFIEDLKKYELKEEYLKANYIWDYIKYVGKMIKKDLKLSNFESCALKNKKFSIVGDRKNLYLCSNVKIYPGNIFDTTNGPVIVDDNTIIKSFSLIEGPAYIGKNSHIDDAQIRGDTYIGNVCKISGEIENSIILSYTNKHHHGFLGHSYLGSWVNLGAYTTNSDLKNSYGEVKVFLTSDKMVNTKELKIGSFIADHVKTGIGTLLNTGCVIGFGSMIYGGGMFPKFIPSFSWANNENWNQYRLEKFIDDETTVMKRRNILMSSRYKKMIEEIFEKTKSERDKVNSLWQN